MLGRIPSKSNPSRTSHSDDLLSHGQIANLISGCFSAGNTFDDAEWWMHAAAGWHDSKRAGLLRSPPMGWGVVVAATNGSAVLEALRPLIRHRQRQLEPLGAEVFIEMYRTGSSFQAAESTREFLRRSLNVPFVVIAAGPESIPFHVQYQLSLRHAVGRLCFEDVNSYAIYARSVVEFEKAREGLQHRSKAAFYAPEYAEDPASRFSCDESARRLADNLAKHPSRSWSVRPYLGESASKSALSSLLGYD